jgi:hypothetical protein
MAHTSGPPADHFTDALLGLERVAAGERFVLPMVTAWEADDGWGIEVSLWSENSQPTADEVAALEGTLAEVLASVRV